MATPNSEQLISIEHAGGVLLKAGAGSGKTFVLKEHMIYLSRQWIKEFKQGSNDLAEFQIFIKTKYRRIILMTFTKKAAGELAIRLDHEFSQILETTLEDREYWEVILNNLAYLNVSTIHGFCLKLIKMGFFPNASADQTVLSEGEYRDVITKIFDDYIEGENTNKIDSEFLELLLKDKKNILKSMMAIFSDPTLRNSWDNAISSNTQINSDIDDITLGILDLLGFKDFLESFFDPADCSEFEGKKWYEFLKSFCIRKRDISHDFKGIVELNNYFSELAYKIPAKPSIKTVPENIVQYYEQLRDLKDYLKKNGEHFSLYQMHFETNVSNWYSEIKKLVAFIEEAYTRNEGVTFSDLEYTVFKGLEDSGVQELINKEFDYFIIDEFQDTSFIQFDIVTSILKNNYDKLFCVGDLKQAIYGFRGGELGVFLNCEKKINQNLSLKNNYRSDSSIINFNNYFFEYLFTKGIGFKGDDGHAVEVEFQNVPESKTDQGNVYRISTQIDFFDESEKISNLEVDYIEALAIIEQIKKIKTENDDIAILYKRLKPSLILTKLLMKSDIGFTAQLKIPFLEDPVVGIFKCLVERYFNENENAEKFQIILLDAYLGIIIGDKRATVQESDLDTFYKHVKRYGLYESFCYFLEKQGLRNSNFINNLEAIKTFIGTTHSRPDELLKLLKKQSEISYSLEFQYGDNANMIKIMSAHASKGLQFSNVILGGIYTNENSHVNTSIIGKIPSSFKWSKTIHGKDKYKTPHLLFEELVEKQKDFSESKRLFYVANTRAENTLGWVDIDFSTVKRSKSPSGAWINGIKTWETEKNNFADISQVNVDLRSSYDESFLADLDFAPPLFHIDNLGIAPSFSKNEKVYLPEISVTKLTSLAQCPRKFYFQNICKISTDDLSMLDESIKKKFESEIEEMGEELSSKNIKKSSAQRGTFIHERISEIIIDDFSTESVSELKNDSDGILWVVDNLEKYRENFYLVSEKQIKFELLGYMISGIPDLIIKPKHSTRGTEIWDFKTGAYSEDKLAPYYFQLYTYAYSQYILGITSDQSPTKLVLCFSDDKKIVEKTVSFENVEKYLIEMLGKTTTPDEKNLNECPFCPYQIICKK
jgi:ATP-dependent exoDNAse (exonuclease V) beta subunit